MITYPANLSPNLRAGRTRGEESAEDLRRMKTILFWVFSICLSIFFNFQNFKRKRTASKISLSALLAFFVDIALLLVLPLQAIYPLLVVLSMLTLLVIEKKEPRSSVVAVSLITAFTNVFCHTQQAFDLAESVGTLFLIIASATSVSISQIIHRIPRVKHVLTGFLSALSALSLKTAACIDITPLSILLVGITVFSSRRTVAIHAHYLSPEHASWAVLTVTLSCLALFSAVSVPCTILSVVCGFSIRFINKPEEKPLKTPEIVTASAIAVASRRKAVHNSLELQQIDDTLEKPALPPDLSTVKTRSSSGVILVVRSSDQSTVASVELEEDEDELFRRITTL